MFVNQHCRSFFIDVFSWLPISSICMYVSVKTRCKKDDDEGVCVCLYVSVCK